MKMAKKLMEMSFFLAYYCKLLRLKVKFFKVSQIALKYLKMAKIDLKWSVLVIVMHF